MLYDLYFEQAGAELCQAQLKLGLDFTLIFCIFGLSAFTRIGRIGFVGLNIFGLVHFVFTFQKFCLVDSACSVGLVYLVLSQRKTKLYIGFGKLGLVAS